MKCRNCPCCVTIEEKTEKKNIVKIRTLCQITRFKTVFEFHHYFYDTKKMKHMVYTPEFSDRFDYSPGHWSVGDEDFAVLTKQLESVTPCPIGDTIDDLSSHDHHSYWDD